MGQPRFAATPAGMHRPRLGRAGASMLGPVVAVAMLLPAPQPASAAEEVSFGDGLLWRIESPSGATSHLFGTMHKGTDGASGWVPNIPARALAVLAGASSAGFEVLQTPVTLTSLAGLMLLPVDQRLADLVDGLLYEDVRTIAGRYDIAEAELQRYKPWAVAITILSPLPDPDLPSGAASTMDGRLERLARKEGMQVFALESVIEQVGPFERLSPSQQAQFLALAVEAHRDLEQELATLTAFYRAHDTGAMYRHYMDSLSDLAPWLRLLLGVDLIIARNHRMAERMVPHFEAGGAFIAIGALHLPGEEGILALLEARGFRLTRLE